MTGSGRSPFRLTSPPVRGWWTRSTGERRRGAGGDRLAIVMETLTALTAEARGGGLDDAAALSSIAAVHLVAAEFEHSELALIEAARAAARPGLRSPARWAPATGRLPRSAMPTSPAAARVHNPWTPRRSQASRPRRPAMTAASQGQARWRPAMILRRPRDGSRLAPQFASMPGCQPSRGSPMPSSPRASTSSCGHPITPRPVPGASWWAAGSRAWSGRPGAGSAAAPAGAGRRRRDRAAGQGHQQGHPRRERPDPRRSRSQPAAHPAAPAGTTAQGSCTLNGAARVSIRPLSASRGGTSSAPATCYLTWPDPAAQAGPAR